MATPKKKTLLKKWLEKNNLTQEWFAQKCDLSLGFTNNLVNGRYTCVRIDVLQVIVAATGLAYDSLVRDLLSFVKKPVAKKKAK